MTKEKYMKLGELQKMQQDMLAIQKLPASKKNGKSFGQIAREFLPSYSILAK